MLLAEELLLLCTEEEGGDPLLPDDVITEALAMALVFELSVRGVTHLDPQARIGRTGSQPADPVLQLAVERVAGATPTEAVRGLLAEDLRAAVLARLVARGVLHEDRGSGRHPERDAHPERAVRERLVHVLVRGAEPVLHDVALVALVDPVGLTARLLPEPDGPAAQAKAAQISAHWREMDAFRPAGPAEPTTPEQESRKRTWTDRFSDAGDVLELVTLPLRIFDGF